MVVLCSMVGRGTRPVLGFGRHTKVRKSGGRQRMSRGANSLSVAIATHCIQRHSLTARARLSRPTAWEAASATRGWPTPPGTANRPELLLRAIAAQSALSILRGGVRNTDKSYCGHAADFSLSTDLTFTFRKNQIFHTISVLSFSHLNLTSFRYFSWREVFLELLINVLNLVKHIQKNLKAKLGKNW